MKSARQTKAAALTDLAVEMHYCLYFINKLLSAICNTLETCVLFKIDATAIRLESEETCPEERFHKSARSQMIL